MNATEWYIIISGNSKLVLKKKATGKKWFIIKSAEADTHRNLHDENIGREKRESNQFKK